MASNNPLKYDVPLFDGKKNFTVWQSTMQDLLVQQGLDVALEAEKPNHLKDYEWNSMKKKAVSNIRLALAPEIKFPFMKETSPKALWDKLESIYASKSLTNRLCMKIDLYSLKMSDGGNLHDHINKFNQLVMQLSNAEEEVKDEEQALLLLSSLPRSYKPIIQTVVAGRTTLKLDEVLVVLRENAKLIGDEDGSNESHALAVEGYERGRNQFQKRGDRRRSKSRPRDNNNVECYYCSEKGHLQSRCPKFKEDLQILKRLKNKNDGENVVTLTEEDDENYIHLVESEDGAANGSVENCSDWVLDNASAMHVCHDRVMFDSLDTVGNFGCINVGNKLKLKVEGTGRVCLKLHDGAVKSIDSVRYVPTAGANIISLGELVSHGYNYSGEGDWCKVFKGGNLIMRGRRSKKNICYLDGHSMRREDDTSIKAVKKSVRFSNEDIVFGDFERGGIVGLGNNSPNPTSILKKKSI